jgi:ParB family chromosome partitioning protein
MRLRAGAAALTSSAKNLNSYLYEWWCLRKLKKEERFLDFGCGQRDYVDMLQAKGFAAWGMEFFYRSGSMLDTKEVHAMCDRLFEVLRTQGLFDVTLADSVVNSVDTLEAENDVLTCLNAFAKPGARIYFAGRTKEGIEAVLSRRTAAASRSVARKIQFLDKNGFSGMYRNGSWFYQKFHSKEEALELGRRYFGGEPQYGIVFETGWQVGTTKTRELPLDQCEAAIRREFDLPWPEGKRVGRGDDAVAAWRAALEISRASDAPELPAHYPNCEALTPAGCTCHEGSPFPYRGAGNEAKPVRNNSF